jgi:hypothetical protein
MPFAITPQEKAATQSTFHPHFLADPFASSKFNVTETFWQSHFASSRLNVTKNWYQVIPLDGPPLIWCWVPHTTFKIKRTGAIVGAEYKHQQTCAFR